MCVLHLSFILSLGNVNDSRLVRENFSAYSQVILLCGFEVKENVGVAKFRGVLVSFEQCPPVEWIDL